LSDLDGQRTPDDLDDTALSDLHDSELGDVLPHSVFGPALDWEGEVLITYYCSLDLMDNGLSQLSLLLAQ